MTNTTVFQSGNSQAVRLPKEFRFASKTVEIFRRGNEVVLREKPRTLGEAWAQALHDLPALTDADRAAFDEAMAIAREPQAQQERDWSWLESDPAALAPTATRPVAKPAQLKNKAASGRHGRR